MFQMALLLIGSVTLRMRSFCVRGGVGNGGGGGVEGLEEEPQIPTCTVWSVVTFSHRLLWSNFMSITWSWMMADGIIMALPFLKRVANTVGDIFGR